MSLSFSGDAIAVYGGVSFDHGNYTVSLDGEEWDLNGANGVARMYHPQVGLTKHLLLTQLTRCPHTVSSCRFIRMCTPIGILTVKL